MKAIALNAPLAEPETPFVFEQTFHFTSGGANEIGFSSFRSFSSEQQKPLSPAAVCLWHLVLCPCPALSCTLGPLTQGQRAGQYRVRQGQGVLSTGQMAASYSGGPVMDGLLFNCFSTFSRITFGKR